MDRQGLDRDIERWRAHCIQWNWVLSIYGPRQKDIQIWRAHSIELNWGSLSRQSSAHSIELPVYTLQCPLYRELWARFPRQRAPQNRQIIYCIQNLQYIEDIQRGRGGQIEQIYRQGGESCYVQKRIHPYIYRCSASQIRYRAANRSILSIQRGGGPYLYICPLYRYLGRVPSLYREMGSLYREISRPGGLYIYLHLVLKCISCHRQIYRQSINISSRPILSIQMGRVPPSCLYLGPIYLSPSRNERDSVVGRVPAPMGVVPYLLSPSISILQSCPLYRTLQGGAPREIYMSCRFSSIYREYRVQLQQRGEILSIQIQGVE